MIFSLSASLLTYFAINAKDMNAVRSSALVTLMLSLVACLFPNVLELQMIIFGASFVGMSLSQKFNYLDIFIATLIFILLLPYIAMYSPNVGGVLGFSAFCSLLIIRFLKILYMKIYMFTNKA
jgi:hypothetical protein